LSAAPGDVEPDAVPRSARGLVGALFVLLLVPGLVGFDLWPLTGWRLFSLARDDTQTLWVLEAVDGDGSSRLVSQRPWRARVSSFSSWVGTGGGSWGWRRDGASRHSIVCRQ